MSGRVAAAVRHAASGPPDHVSWVASDESYGDNGAFRAGITRRVWAMPLVMSQALGE